MAVDTCGNQSNTVTEVYDIDLEAPTGLVATPAGGSYCASPVSLGTSEGTIYYTLDGTEPTNGSPVYTEPVDITGDTTLKFMAVDACGNQSVTVTEVYDIDDEAVVTITFPMDGVTVSAGEIWVTGTADTDIITVTVTSDQNHIESSAVDAGGNWSVVLSEFITAPIIITAQVIDSCGNIGSDSVLLYVKSIWFVYDNASLGGDGRSWDTAFTVIQEAADAALSGDIIWVAEGTYTSSDSSDPVLTMKDGVEVYGGFEGIEIDLSERGDPAVHKTILDGEGESDNVVIGASNARLDGFIVTGGNGDNGGGMSNYDVANLVVTNCTFRSNHSDYDGGGMSNYNSSLTITNCVFIDNSAEYGGGMENWNSSPTITNCIFIDNSAEYGGGMENYDFSLPTIINCTFIGNIANKGSGMCNWYSSSPTITNCIIWADTVPTRPIIYNYSWSHPIITYSNIHKQYAHYHGEGNININPLFVSGPNGDYYLSQQAAGQGENSPCVNAGSDTAVNLGLDNRTTRTDCFTDTGTVDMGYHYPLDMTPPGNPVASPLGGSYCPTLVALSCDDPWATIYYTTDGTEPTNASTEYTGPIDISLDTTLKAIAEDSCSNISEIITEVYTIDTLPPIIAINSPSDGAILGSTETVVTISTDTEDGQIVTVTVNGITTYKGSVIAGTATIDVSLPYCQNTITADVEDKCGNPAIPAIVNVTADLTAPTVNIISPIPGEYINTLPVVVTGDYSDTCSGISTITVDGVTAILTGTTSVGTFTASLYLGPGPSSISATAVDYADNFATTLVSIIVVDMIPPIIADTTDFPNTSNGDGPFTIFTTITDNIGLDPSNLYLYYSIDGAPFQQISLINISDDIYRAVILPATTLPPGTKVQYYIFAGDLCGNTSTDPSGAPANFIQFVITSCEPLGYISNIFSDTVTVVDTGSKMELETINVEKTTWDLKITPDDKRVYVANVTYGTISVIDTATNSIIDTINVGDKPYYLAITPDGKKVYVSLLSGSLSVIETDTNTVIKSINIDGGGFPFGIAITPDGARAYVNRRGFGDVCVIDTDTDTVIDTVAVGGEPIKIAISPNGDKAYVTKDKSNWVSVIYIPSNTVLDIWVDVQRLFDITFNLDGNKVYATTGTLDYVYVFDAVNDIWVDKIYIPGGTEGIDVSSISISTEFAYVTVTNPPRLSIIDTAIDAHVDTIYLSEYPLFIDVQSGLPRITDTTILANTTYTGPHTVTATITDNSRIVSASLFYSTDASFREIPMVNMGDDLYSAFIPEQLPCTIVKYYISAIDDCGNVVTDPFNAPAGTFKFGIFTEVCEERDFPIDVALSPDGSLALVTTRKVFYNPEDADLVFHMTTPFMSLYYRKSLFGNLFVVNTATGSLDSIIPVGREPRSVAISSDGELAFVANSLDNTVSVVNIPARSVIKIIPLGPPLPTYPRVELGPIGIGISPDGNKLVILHSYRQSVLVYDISNLPGAYLLAEIPLSFEPSPFGGSLLAVSPPGSGLNLALVPHFDRAIVIDLDGLSIREEVGVSYRNFGLGVDIGNSGIAAISAFYGGASFIDLTTIPAQEIAHIPGYTPLAKSVGFHPVVGVAISPDGNTALFPIYNPSGSFLILGRDVVAVDLNTFSEVGRVAVGQGPVAIDAAAGKVVVLNILADSSLMDIYEYNSPGLLTDAGELEPGTIDIFSIPQPGDFPLITSISPTAAKVGETITIQGNNFGADPSLITVEFPAPPYQCFINGVQAPSGIVAPAESVNPGGTSLIATVPLGAISGPCEESGVHSRAINITVNGKRSSFIDPAGSFSLIPEPALAPFISNVDISYDSCCVWLEISGSGFSESPQGNVVTLGTACMFTFVLEATPTFLRVVDILPLSPLSTVKVEVSEVMSNIYSLPPTASLLASGSNPCPTSIEEYFEDIMPFCSDYFSCLAGLELWGE